MKILALEFSSEQRSIAVLSADGKGQARLLAEIIETGKAGMHALGMIESGLLQAQVAAGEIEVLAIGLGPGSYTGIRLAIALAQGWQLAHSVKLVGISSVECLAAQAQSDGILGEIAVVIDAQRSEFYLGRYEIAGSRRKEIHPLRLATVQEVESCCISVAAVVGPEAARFRGGRPLFPRAAVLAELARGREDFIAGELMEPVYLRETAFVKAPPPRILPD
jgi:tRNA threonylcarbamoyl adenosine modification protein YeaZ